MGDFKRITVTAADDDEVIIAGVGESKTAPSQETLPQTDETPVLSPSAQEGDAFERASSELSSNAEEGDASKQDSDLAARAADPSRVASASNAKPKRRPRDDSYHETTLEDLESGPMPAAQKITLIAVVVLLVIAIGYYFAFLR